MVPLNFKCADPFFTMLVLTRTKNNNMNMNGKVT